MPTELKVAIVVNVVSAVAILVIASWAFTGIGFAPGMPGGHEVHELVLIPVSPEEARRLRRVPDLPRPESVPLYRPDIPPEYRADDAIPSPWRTMPDGSVRMLRTD